MDETTFAAICGAVIGVVLGGLGGWLIARSRFRDRLAMIDRLRG
jgi:NhaP-type Na+/H+ or K+/H+ antiporter